MKQRVVLGVVWIVFALLMAYLALFDGLDVGSWLDVATLVAALAGFLLAYRSLAGSNYDDS